MPTFWKEKDKIINSASFACYNKISVEVLVSVRLRGLHIHPHKRGFRAPRTCQILLQWWWSALVPAVAEAEPEQQGDQHQNQDPEEPSHGWVSHSPCCKDIHVKGCRTHTACHKLSFTLKEVWLQQNSWMGCSRPLCVLSGQHKPGEQQPQMDTSCSTRSSAQTPANVSSVWKCVLTSVSCVLLSPGKVLCVCVCT